MALTRLQRDVCRLLAAARRASGESYVAGGVALNEATAGARRSRDVDVFHDALEAVERTADADRRRLADGGFGVDELRARPGFVEVLVRRGTESVRVEWVRDSAFRYFPLVEDATFGLTLHPVDLATNKLLALVGRREPRDWVDVIRCDEVLQPLGYLAWAASGKDPGFSPLAVVEEAARSARWTQVELDALDFDGPAPSAAELSRRWHEAVREARDVVAALPPEHAGTCVLRADGALLREAAASLAGCLERGEALFHPGAIKGAFPLVREA